MRHMYGILLLALLATPFVVRAQDGRLDASFVASAKPYVYALQKLRDGRVLAAWCQATAGGISVYNSDGTANSLNLVGAPQQIQFTNQNRYINDFIEQPDGKIVVLGGNTDPRMSRHFPDGTLDQAFMSNIGKGPNLRVFKGVLHPDGKLLLIGEFTTFNEQPVGKIVRLNSDGSIDKTFNATGTTSTAGLTDAMLLSDGRYYVAGPNISVYNGQGQYTRFMRLLPDGNVDTTFRAPQEFKVSKFSVLSNGQVVGLADGILYKLHTDGKIDGTFREYVSVRAGNRNGTAAGIHVQRDDKIILTGTFDKVNGQNVNNVVRLLPNGEIDPTFMTGTGPSHDIFTSQLTDDGAILVGGLFVKYDGVDKDYIARLANSTGPLYPENLTTSVQNDAEARLNLQLYPNPTTGSINVAGTWADADARLIVTIRDLTGNQIHSQVLTGITGRVQLPPACVSGPYCITVTDPSTGRVAHQMMIVN